jgi:hypothetical protein
VRDCPRLSSLGMGDGNFRNHLHIAAAGCRIDLGKLLT